MRVCAAIWLIGVSLACGSTTALASSAQPACATTWPREGFEFEGRIDEIDVRVFLDTGYPAKDPDNGVSGIVVVWKEWLAGRDESATIGTLDGTFTGDCELVLKDEETARGEYVWRLRFAQDGRLEGTRHYSDGSVNVMQVSLRVIQPTDCGARERWRTYTSARSPVTSQYPVSWRLVETSDYVLLQCPDVHSLAFGADQIAVSTGRGREKIEAEDGRVGTMADNFVTFGRDQWLMSGTSGACERAATAPSLFCQPARKSRRRGMLLLQGAARECRRYRAGGGYVGLGDGCVDYLFLVGEEWVSIQTESSLIDTEKVGRGGQVLFDRRDVAGRLVRSVKRR